MEKDTTKTHEEGLLEVYRRLRPGEPPTVDSAQSLISSTFFDPKRYDMAKVGRYKYNKKLMLSDRVTGHVSAENIISPVTGEILCEAGQTITKEIAHSLEINAD